MKNKRAKITRLLLEVRKDAILYRKHKRFVNLSQACEKTWVACNFYLEYNFNVEIKSGKNAETLAYATGLSGLYNTTHELHVLHYEGSPGANDGAVLREIEESVNAIQRLLVLKQVFVRKHVRLR